MIKQLLCTFIISCTLFPQPTHAQSRAEWRDSLEKINRMVNLSPHSVELRLRKAAINLELEQWEYAAEEYGRVLEIEPANLSALYFRAYANSRLNRLDMARRDYERILSRVPRHFEAQLGLAMILRQMNHAAETIDQLNQLVQMYPDSAMAYVARAGFETEQRQYDLAVYDWEQARRLAPDNIDYLVSEVETLLQAKQKKEARNLLEQAIHHGVPVITLKEWLERCK